MPEQLALPAPLLTADQVAATLGVCRETVYRLARAGELGAVRVRRALRFRSEDVRAYLDRGASAPWDVTSTVEAQAARAAAPRAAAPRAGAPAPAWLKPIAPRTRKAG